MAADVENTNWDKAWDIISTVRDAHPREVGDADTGEIVDALMAAGLIHENPRYAVVVEVDGVERRSDDMVFMTQIEAQAAARAARFVDSVSRRPSMNLKVIDLYKYGGK